MAGARLNGKEFSRRGERRALARDEKRAQREFQATVDLKPVFDAWTRNNVHVSVGAALTIIWTCWYAINFAYSHSPLRNGVPQPIPEPIMLELAFPPALTIVALAGAAATLISEVIIQKQHQHNWRANITNEVTTNHAKALGVTPERYLGLVKPSKK